MGAWGNGNFDNDQAMDFVGDFTDEPTLETIEHALTVVVDVGEEGEYIEVDEASAALAAAEMVAALLKKPASDLPENLQPALASMRSNAALQKLARKAVKQVLKESELQELWAENGEPNDWQAVQEDLVKRLS
ncbi:MAG: DUF4259 domain-containing protein [Hymenobacter sp.]